MSRKVTLKDLSMILNLSPSTVSKALNNSPEISQFTKDRVIKAAEEFFYVPSHAARSLKCKITKNIGVLMPSVIDGFFAQILHGMENEASKHGFKLVISFLPDRKAIKKKLEELANHGVDGVILSIFEYSSKDIPSTTFNIIRLHNIPLVLIGGGARNEKYDFVTIDFENVAYMSAKLLIDVKCTNIFFLYSNSKINGLKAKKRGYISALKNESLKKHRPIFLFYDSLDSLKDKLTNALNKDAPNGILILDEGFEQYVINLLGQLNFNTPDLVRAVVLKNGTLRRSCNPMVTEVSCCADKIGAKSFHVLKRKLVNRKAETRKIILKAEVL